MIIAHLPAGYIGAKLLAPRLKVAEGAFRPFLIAGLIGAIAPDFDLLYFYLVSQHQRHHHTLWPHFPILWASLLLVSVLWFHVRRGGSGAPMAVIFSLNGMVHMVLDTVVGKIWWLMPFVDKPYALFTVSARYHPWWLNFLFHWTFVFEGAIIAWAIYLWRRAPVPVAAPQQAA